MSSIESSELSKSLEHELRKAHTEETLRMQYLAAANPERTRDEVGREVDHDHAPCARERIRQGNNTLRSAAIPICYHGVDEALFEDRTR